MIAAHYSTKWGSNNLALRTVILDRVLAYDGVAPDITPVQLSKAFSSIRHKTRCDAYGVSVGCLFIIFCAQPHTIINFLSSVIASTPHMSSFAINGRGFGKESPSTAVTKTKAILPLPAVLQVLDAFDSFLVEQLPKTPETFVGAQPGTPCLDIMHALHLVIEKGVDMHGAAGIAQQDIHQFFDSIPLFKICVWMVTRGCPWSLAACVLRHQLLPRVVLKTGDAACIVLNRTIGGLTGSRLAGCMARIPVESIVVERSTAWRIWGFALERSGCDRNSADCHILCIAAWVDNIFAVSGNLLHAVWLLEDFALQLNAKWGLHIKPTSRSCMAAAGSCEQTPDALRWPQVKVFEALGHKLQDNGSVQACWTHTRSNMWASFRGNVACKDAKQLPVSVRAGLLKRATLPVLDYRCSRWPPQEQIKKQIDTLQRKMASIILHVQPYPGEEAQYFATRRNRLAAGLCRRMGWWSARWWKRFCDWDAHIRRDSNPYSWCHDLVTWYDEAWLSERRAVASGLSSATGRTRTRAIRGRPQQRWQKGIEMATHR